MWKRKSWRRPERKNFLLIRKYNCQELERWYKEAVEEQEAIEEEVRHLPMLEYLGLA